MKQNYKYKPETKKELIEVIKKEIYEVQGTKDKPNWKANLNHIDTSLITDMFCLFSKEYGLNKLNGNISEWNISNVYNMEYMFARSKFNKDISNWNVKNVKYMDEIFEGTKINIDVNKWKLGILLINLI